MFTLKICNSYSSMLPVLPDTDGMKPLDGVRILDLTRFVLDYLQSSECESPPFLKGFINFLDYKDIFTCLCWNFGE